GCMAGWMSGYRNRVDGLLQGVVVWGMLTVVAFWAAGTAFGAILNTTTTLLSSGLQSAGMGMQEARQEIAATTEAVAPESMTFETSNYNFDQVAQQLSGLLRDIGKDQLQPAQIEQGTQRIQSVARSAAKMTQKHPEQAQKHLDRVLNAF